MKIEKITDFTYKHENKLFGILMFISVIFWAALIIGTLGIALVYILLFFIFYLFAQSAFISYLKGTGVKITADQFPDLYKQYLQCCEKLDIIEKPEIYLIHADGAFNAFATKFLGVNFVALYSDVVDALDAHKPAIKFYIGHELGHIKRNHLKWAPILFPAALLPLIGAAYSRACEYTCDLYGVAACDNPNDAAFGLAAIAAGGKRWSKMSVDQYAKQSAESGAFWMSFHELISDYPWMVKRMAHMRSDIKGSAPDVPKRSFFAWLLALFVPRIGTSGGAPMILVTIAIIGILAAIAIPAYQDYTTRAKVSEAFILGDTVKTQVETYIYDNNTVPPSLADAGVNENIQSAVIDSISINENGVIIIDLANIPTNGETSSILFTPNVVDEKLVWDCSGGSLLPKFRPAKCR